MESNGIKQKKMKRKWKENGKKWNYMDFYGIKWIFMELNGFLWN